MKLIKSIGENSEIFRNNDPKHSIHFLSYIPGFSKIKITLKIINFLYKTYSQEKKVTVEEKNGGKDL